MECEYKSDIVGSGIMRIVDAAFKIYYAETKLLFKRTAAQSYQQKNVDLTIEEEYQRRMLQ